MSKDKAPSTIKSTFIAGLLTVLPTIITIAISVWLFGLLTGYVPQILEMIETDTKKLENLKRYTVLFQFASLVLFIIFTYFIGIFTRNVIGTKVLAFGELLLLKVPVLSTIYSTVRQIFRPVFGNNDAMFSKVVMIEYPKEGAWVIGFMTKDAAPECNEKIGKELQSSVIY